MVSKVVSHVLNKVVQVVQVATTQRAFKEKAKAGKHSKEFAVDEAF